MVTRRSPLSDIGDDRPVTLGKGETTAARLSRAVWNLVSRPAAIEIEAERLLAAIRRRGRWYAIDDEPRRDE